MLLNTTKRIEAADKRLAEVMGRAKTHAFLSAQEIVDDADCIVDNLHLTKSAAEGVEITMVSGCAVANSYRGRPIRTRVTLVRRPAGWEMTEVWKGEFPLTKPKVTLNEVHYSAIVRSVARNAEVRLHP